MFAIQKIRECYYSCSIKKAATAAVLIPSNILSLLITCEAYGELPSSPKWLSDAGHRLGKGGSMALLLGTTITSSGLLLYSYCRAHYAHVSIDPDSSSELSTTQTSDEGQEGTLSFICEEKVPEQEHEPFEVVHVPPWEERKLIGDSYALTVKPLTSPSILKLAIQPVKFKTGEFWNLKPTEFACYGFTIMDPSSLSLPTRNDLEELLKQAPACRKFQNQYLFYSLSEINIPHIHCYQDLEIHYNNSNIAYEFTQQQKVNFLTTMTPQGRARQIGNNYCCTDFFNDIFGQELPLNEYCDYKKWKWFFIEKNLCPPGLAGVLLYKTSTPLRFPDNPHWEVHLGLGMTASRIGTTGDMVFASIEDSKVLYFETDKAIFTFFKEE